LSTHKETNLAEHLGVQVTCQLKNKVRLGEKIGSQD